jgi:nucleoside phosphorylase
MTTPLKLEDCKHVPQKPMHEGHVPDDPRTLLVEEMAMIMCGHCSEGRLRWLSHDYKEWCHNDDFGREATECEADAMLDAAKAAGVPLYTGAELEFDQLSD